MKPATAISFEAFTGVSYDSGMLLFVALPLTALTVICAISMALCLWQRCRNWNAIGAAMRLEGDPDPTPNADEERDDVTWTGKPIRISRSRRSVSVSTHPTRL